MGPLHNIVRSLINYNGGFHSNMFRLVITSCIIAPYMLAFQDDNKDSSSLFYIDTLINVLFAFDIMLIFFTAYIDDEALELVDDYKVNRHFFDFFK